RVKEIQELGAGALEKIEEISSEKEKDYEELLDTKGTIKPLF
ncbi:cell division protein, partial [Methanosarcinales archaeon]